MGKVHALLQESWDSVDGEQDEGPAAKALRSLEEQVRAVLHLVAQANCDFWEKVARLL